MNQRKLQKRKTEYEDTLDCYNELQLFYHTLLNILEKYSDFFEVKGLKSFLDEGGIFLIAYEKHHKIFMGNSWHLGKFILENGGEDIFKESKIFVYPYEAFIHGETKTLDNIRNKVYGIHQLVPSSLIATDFILEGQPEIIKKDRLQSLKKHSLQLKDDIKNAHINKKKCLYSAGIITTTLVILSGLICHHKRK